MPSAILAEVMRSVCRFSLSTVTFWSTAKLTRRCSPAGKAAQPGVADEGGAGAGGLIQRQDAGRQAGFAVVGQRSEASGWRGWVSG
jgi:hypothetical protein